MHKTLWLTLAGVWLSAFGRVCQADEIVSITYELSDLGAGKWEFRYDVTNHALVATIEEFTIWFEFGSMSNLAITTPDPPANGWDELVVQPEPLISEDGFYDTLTLGDAIMVGETVGGFSVSFDWIGPGIPGPQTFDIVDPISFATLHTGQTVPEPGTALLFSMAILAIYARRPKKAELTRD
ncbi:MAG: PEP-CTERM sorting domain-containing protein [Planctomycetota bacterium]